jgi:hypothetical protein
MSSNTNRAGFAVFVAGLTGIFPQAADNAATLPDFLENK